VLHLEAKMATPMVAPVALDKKQKSRLPRRARRRRSDLEVTIRCMGMTAFGRLYDISTAGAAIDLDRPIAAAVGMMVRIEATALTFLEGKVRWQRNSRIGIEFDPNTNAIAKMNAYFKFYHRDPMVETK
jgi:hypothetical protein